MTHRFALTACALATALLSPLAQANLLTNGSFEQADLTGGSNYCYMGTSCALAGWTGNAVVIGAGSGAWGWPAAPVGYSYGNQLIGLQQGSSVSQLLNVVAGQYELDWADSGRFSNWGVQFFGAAQYQVLFNNQLLGTYTTQPGEAWATNHLSFTASGPGMLTFQGIYLNADTTAFIDGLNLTGGRALPEPSSLGLAALALAGVSLLRRRRRA